MSKLTISAKGGAMCAVEARHFLETCNDAIEAGMTADLRRRILAARAVVVADLAERRAAEFDLARRAGAYRALRRARMTL